MIRSVTISWLATMAAFLLAPLLLAQPPAGGNWPQWRGPDRTNVSSETSLLQEWPADGPPLLWKAEKLGGGVPSVAVAGGKVYILGYRDGKEYLTALDEKSGAQLWSSDIGEAVKEIRGMRWLLQRTPMVDGDRVYAFRASGELVCLATADGKEKWRKDYRKECGGRSPSFGYVDYPLVDGDKLICTPGGPTAAMVALNKVSGEVIWKCAIPGNDAAAYGAAVVTEACGIRQYVNYTRSGVVGVSADGKFLWKYDGITNGTANAYTPIVRGDFVFVASGYGTGFAQLQLVKDGTEIKVEERYKVRKSLQPWVASSALVDEHVYLCGGNSMAPMQIEIKTGKVVWEAGRTIPLGGQCSMTYADGRMYLHSATGKMFLIEPTVEGIVKRGEFLPPRAPSNEPAWTFPVVTGGRLYVRDQELLYCYDVRAKKPRRRGPDVIFVPTPQDVVEKMLELAGVTKTDVVVDLGCGDGRIIVTAAKKYGCKAIGYDIDPDCVRRSKENIQQAGVGKLVRVECADMFDVDLSGVSVVMLYIGPSLNAKLLPQFRKMKTGARIVSHAFDMPGVRPDKVISVTSLEDDIARKLYRWTLPLKVEAK